MRRFVLLWAAAGCAAPGAPPLERGVTIVTSPNLKNWLPEGNADELQPCEIEEDLVLHCTWKGNGPPRHLYVELDSTNYPGSAINSGRLTCADLTVEGSRNPAWTIVGPDIPEYRGIQSANIEGKKGVTARTTRPAAAGELVELRITSYDGGGSAKATIYAENCDPASP